MADGQVQIEDAPVARLHLRSTVEGVDHAAIEEWCVGTGGDGWAGVGWGLWAGAEVSGIDWEEYLREVGGEANPSVVRLHDLPSGSLLWTRRQDGSYWLGRLTGPWEYRDGEEAQGLDMFNVRRCFWRRAGIEDVVPGKVVNNFKASRTLNPVADWGAVRYSRRLCAQLAGSQNDLAAPSPDEVISSLLGAADLEDLVAVFLQDRHDLVLVSRHESTAGYEYVLRDRQTGKAAVASVKSGGSPVDLDALPRDPEVDKWAYAVRDRNSVGQPRKDVRWISTEELASFIQDRANVLPDQVRRWLR